MIKYTLKCREGHAFDSWFDTSAAFDKLQKAGHLTCAVCGSADVEKAIMAPKVQTSDAVALSEPTDAEKALSELRDHVEATSEDVGTEFANEARAIYYGDAPDRAIYGEAKLDEAKSLIEEGVPVAPLPWSSRRAN